MGSILHHLETEGCDNVAIFYDIYCHWFKKWWERACLLPSPVEQPKYYVGGIPKYHITGHVDLCWVLYSINLLKGMGRLDAEGCERLWADANLASGSTSTKGSGSRIDALNHMFQDWNWRKLITIAALIVRKFKEAAEMAVSQQAQWQAFNDAMPSKDVLDWQQMSMEVEKLKDGTVKSVYLPIVKPALSITKSLELLRKLEAQDDKSKGDESKENESKDDDPKSRAKLKLKSKSKSKPKPKPKDDSLKDDESKDNESKDDQSKDESPETPVFSPADWLAEGVEIEKQQMTTSFRHRLVLEIKSSAKQNFLGENCAR
ncbi:hypothetical protein FRC09_010194, partial [Ceratobasidium sp. 395]